MRLFVEVHSSEHCNVTDAAYWVALGRVPSGLPIELLMDGSGAIEFEDAESVEQYISEGEHNDAIKAFEHSEFLSFGIELDYERYLLSLDGTFGRPGSAHLKWVRQQHDIWIAETEGKETPEQEAVRVQQWNDAVEAAESYDWAKQQERPLVSIVDRARALVFEALASGRLTAKGWREYTELEMEQNGGKGPSNGLRGRIETIPANRWSLRGYDWDSYSLYLDDLTYEAASVRTDELLDSFPEPLCGITPVTGQLAASSLMIEGPTAVVRAPTRRGRPPKANGLARTAVRNHFNAKKSKGELAEKSEANIQEAIEWSQEILNEKISRSCAQRWLKGII